MCRVLHKKCINSLVQSQLILVMMDCIIIKMLEFPGNLLGILLFWELLCMHYEVAPAAKLEKASKLVLSQSELPNCM